MPEMKITHNITLDMLKPRYEVVNVKQGAELTQWVRADLVVGGSAWTPPSDATVEVRCKKPDRTAVLYSSTDSAESDAFIISGSSVEVRLHAQTMTCAGKFPVDIAFKKGNETLPLFSFILDVERQAATNGDIASGSYINGVLATIHANVHMLTREEYDADIAADRQNWVDVVQNPETASFDFNFDIPYGEKGDPASISSVTYEYAQTTTTTVPTSWSTSRPAPVAGRYMWTKMTVTFSTTDRESGTIIDQPESLITVVRNGTNGGGAAADTKPKIDSGTGVAGSSTDLSRSDHQHPLNVPGASAPTPPPIDTESSNGSSATTTYARSDHKHASQNKSVTLTLPANTDSVTNWSLQDSGDFKDLYKYTLTVSTNDTLAGFFVSSGYVYFVTPAFASREDYASFGIAAYDVTVNNQITFYATSEPTAAVSVNIMKMVSA